MMHDYNHSFEKMRFVASQMTEIQNITSSFITCDQVTGDWLTKGQFWGSQRPISRNSNVQLSSNFSHSCMARRRIIGEILGQF